MSVNIRTGDLTRQLNIVLSCDEVHYETLFKIHNEILFGVYTSHMGVNLKRHSEKLIKFTT